jgi:glycosyltransferase involved in cell wall biosynthesis
LRFSILVPTRDRLEYLRYAVETVRRQDYADWELIVSDNCSEDDIRGFVASLDDPRVKYLRTDEVLPVTENWNRALEASSGDYVLMLGDDDGLLPGFFRKTEDVLAEFLEPDVVYSRALLLAYPNVMPGQEPGYVHAMGCAAFFDELVEPRELEPEVAHELVRASMELRLRFDFNMQLFTVKRSTVEALRRQGRFFHSPFPDYYAANLLFLRSRRIVIHPDPLTVVGITPKSYGFFHFNRRESEGAEFLRNASPARGRELMDVLLPGSRMNTCWLLAMETLAELDAEAVGLTPSRGRYRLVQVADSLSRRFIEESLSPSESRELVHALRPWERAAYRVVAASFFLLARFRRLRPGLSWVLQRSLGQYPSVLPTIRAGEYESVIDLFERVESIVDLEPIERPANVGGRS